jgi:hypothetical protein
MRIPSGLDPLEAACGRIWAEILLILDQRRALEALAPHSDLEAREIADLDQRLRELRSYSQVYREVLRREAWARAGYPF